jgi:hypothetical protein
MKEQLTLAVVDSEGGNVVKVDNGSHVAWIGRGVVVVCGGGC